MRSDFRVPDSGLRWLCGLCELCASDSRFLMSHALEVLAQQIAPEVAVEIAPDRMNMVGVVLRIVIFDQKCRPLDPVIVRFAMFRLAGPAKRDLLHAGSTDLRLAIFSEIAGHRRCVRV